MIRAQRLHTLSRIAMNEPGIFTISLRALLRHMSPIEFFKKNIRTILLGKEYDIPLLVSDLVSNGYKREFQVTKVGEYAQRGGIFDFYGPNQQHPVRIEFFGDEVTSIQNFNIQNQRSLGNHLDKIIILPMREFSLHDISCDEQFFWEKIHEKGFYEGIELDVYKLLQNTEAFADFFTLDNSIFFWDEFQFIASEVENIFAETTELWLRAKKKSSKNLPKPEENFHDEHYVYSLLNNYQNHFLSNSYQQFKSIRDYIEIKTQNHHNLHGNLELLEKDLSLKLQDNYQVIIQSDNSSQRKSLV